LRGWVFSPTAGAVSGDFRNLLLSIRKSGGLKDISFTKNQRLEKLFILFCWLKSCFLFRFRLKYFTGNDY
jgi:hypothetical protein